jgi:hypothetical protein
MANVVANVVVDMVAAAIVVVDAAALIAEVGVVASTAEVDARAKVIDGVRCIDDDSGAAVCGSRQWSAVV